MSAHAMQDRDNNFNLVRVVAALLVIVTHAFGVTGHGRNEPLVLTFGTSFGSWAVDIFFVTSGFLIAKSWDRRRAPWAFLRARFLRIYPALWVCVALCVLVVGLGFTQLPPQEFLMHLSTWKFALENATLLPLGVYTTLPGTFAAAGAEGSVNVPLWTLPYELKMYLGLLALGMTGLLYRKLVPLMLAVVAGSYYIWCIATSDPETSLELYARLGFFFACGTTIYVNRDRIPLKWAIALPLLAVVGLSLVMPSVAVRGAILALATPYLVIFLALVPGGRIRLYNRVGDYSYGLYIYGYPVQQSLVALAGGAMSVAANLFGTIGVAGLCAVASWHLIEKRALAFASSRRARATAPSGAVKTAESPP